MLSSDDHALGRLIVRDRIDPLEVPPLPLRPVGTAAAFERVVARSALQRVVAVPAVEEVVAAISGERVAAVVADERVRELTADEVLDAEVGVAFRFAAGPHSRGQARNDAGGGVEVARRIGAWSTVERIGAGAAVDKVVAAEAEDRVIAAVAVR